MCENDVEQASFSVVPRKQRPKETQRKWALRLKFFRESNGICPYCGVKMFLPCKNKDGETKTFPDTATFDHIIPTSKGGTNQQSNLLLCCADCNSRKGNSSLVELMHLKRRLVKLNEHNVDEKNLRVRLSVWFSLEPE